MKNSKFLKFAFITYCILLICQLMLKFIIQFNDYQALFEHWNFADWLINYEGGFVRRGLLGQFVLFLYRCFNIDIGQVLHITSLLSTLVLIFLIINLFIRKRMSLFILPTVVMLGTFAINNITSFRRDQLMLLIIFLVLYLYKKYIVNKKNIYYLLFCLVGILVILIHEASFFCFVPLVFMHQCKNLEMKEIVKSILFVTPILTVMGICCIFNGDVNTANVIWDSYQPYFVDVYGESLPMSEAVNALNWDLSFAMKHHLRMNYLIFPRMFGWLITFFATFYLCANTNRINLFSYESKEVNSISLTSILIFQFISLLPLFTVLSCDLGRITIYWTITSFFIYSLFENAINIYQFTNVSLRINEIFNSRLLSNRYFYIFIVVVVFCPLVWFVIPDAYNSTIIGNIHRFIELVYKLL